MLHSSLQAQQDSNWKNRLGAINPFMQIWIVTQIYRYASFRHCGPENFVECNFLLSSSVVTACIPFLTTKVPTIKRKKNRIALLVHEGSHCIIACIACILEFCLTLKSIRECRRGRDKLARSWNAHRKIANWKARTSPVDQSSYRPHNFAKHKTHKHKIRESAQDDYKEDDHCLYKSLSIICH